MTEDDTFNALKRRPFLEVYKARQVIARTDSSINNIEKREQMYRDMGWDVQDFRDALQKYVKKYESI